MMVIHVATGVKTVLIRKKIVNRAFDYLLLLVMIGARATLHYSL
jgi:hypothetical protein